ncbi:MAG: hypothetical protein IJM90_05810 [Firmicutes bacterium]|nr:hypothetical protein [Bacillota bacterium]
MENKISSIKYSLTLFSVIIAVFMLCSCNGQDAATSSSGDKPFLESIVSLKNGTLEPVLVSYGMTISEVAASLGLREEDYDTRLNRLIGHFEHPSLTEPAVLDIGFLEGKVASLSVYVFHQENMEAFQNDLYQQTENYIPKEWLLTRDNDVNKMYSNTIWVDPQSNSMSISEGSAGDDGRALSIQLNMYLGPR